MTARWRSRFFYQIRFHRQLADLAFQCCDLGFVFRNGAGSGFFAVEFAVVVLVQPELDQVGGNAVALLCSPASQFAIPDIAAKLQFEFPGMSSAGSSCGHVLLDDPLQTVQLFSLRLFADCVARSRLTDRA
jgi:hypothetical protein